MTRRLGVRRVAGAAYRRVPRSPFRLVMPTRLMRPLFRFWLSVLGSDGDRRRSVRELLITYDDAYRALDRAAIEYDGGVHVKHRLTRYHDFFVERVEPGERVLDVGSGKGELAFDLVTRAGATVVGVDHDQSHLDFARARFSHERLEFQSRRSSRRAPRGPLRRRRPLQRPRASRSTGRVPAPARGLCEPEPHPASRSGLCAGLDGAPEGGGGSTRLLGSRSRGRVRPRELARRARRSRARRDGARADMG